jgi:hypothetical protein
MAISSFMSFFGHSPERDFWNWFAKNDDRLFHFERDQETVFDELSRAMGKVDSHLTFEFGPVMENGKREFVISAGGIVDAFPAVELLFESAPELARWHFIKYRPRRFPPNDIEFGGKSIAAEDVHYHLFKDGAKIGIVVFFDGYNDDEGDIYGQIGFLYLDEALGEYDIETKVGVIEFHDRSSARFDGARPISELPAHFDEHAAKTVN